VTRIELETDLLPHVIADSILNEVCAYLGADFAREINAEQLNDILVKKAERVYEASPSFQHRLKLKTGRDTLLVFMRHWLSATLKKTHPLYFHQLPSDYAVGHELSPRRGPIQRCTIIKTKEGR
jgi:hypothetical protein